MLSQANNIGGFTVVQNCKQFGPLDPQSGLPVNANVVITTTMQAENSYAIAPVAVGICNTVFTGDGGQSVSVNIVVTNTSIVIQKAGRKNE